MGTVPDSELAQQLQRSKHSIQTRRRFREIPVKRAPRVSRKPQHEKLLKRLPDKEVARRTGRSLRSVARRRRQLGRFFRDYHPKEWTAKEDALLGTDTDRAIAKKLGRNPAGVAARRMWLGLKSTRHSWTNAQDALVARHSDEEAARRLGLSISAVKNRRFRIKVPTVDPGWRRFTPEEDLLLGTDTDQAVARRLGRDKGSVQSRRAKLGIPLPNESGLRKNWQSWERDPTPSWLRNLDARRRRFFRNAWPFISRNRKGNRPSPADHTRSSDRAVDAGQLYRASNWHSAQRTKSYAWLSCPSPSLRSLSMVSLPPEHPRSPLVLPVN